MPHWPRLLPLVLPALIGIGACGTDHPAEPPLQTIPSLDVPRYMGTWYEVAKYPNRFQKDCVGGSRADYTAQDDGSVQVINRCRLASGADTEAIGEARQIGDAYSPKLEVRFAPAWLGWLPAVWGKYWVIDLDPAYQVAVISEPGREYLWVLSRTPTLDPATLNATLARVAAKGFDLSKVTLSPP